MPFRNTHVRYDSVPCWEATHMRSGGYVLASAIRKPDPVHRFQRADDDAIVRDGCRPTHFSGEVDSPLFGALHEIDGVKGVLPSPDVHAAVSIVGAAVVPPSVSTVHSWSPVSTS